MKKLITFFAIALLATLVVPVQADAKSMLQDNLGCGVGTRAFDREDNGLLTHITAYSTNDHSSTQWTGISMGTLGCKKFKSLVSKETEIFVAKNMDNLAKDIAMGEGESIETLAELLDIKTGKKTDFYALLQGNFDSIYATEDIQYNEVIESIVTLIS